MLAQYLVFALLQTMVYGRISINIKPKSHGATFDYNGEDVQLITDQERSIFKIKDDVLKKASEKFNGKTCSSIYLKPPTPWGDVYEKNGWTPVKSTIKPFYASITSFKTSTVLLGEKEFFNGNDTEATFKMSITEDVAETVSHTWKKGRKLGAKREIDYSINFGDKSLGGTTSFTYSAIWGDGPTKSRPVTIGKSASTEASIPAGGKVVARLMAKLTKVEVEVRYESIIDGQVCCHYEGGYKGHNFYALPLKELLYTAQSPLSIYAIETIAINTYSNVRLEIN